MRTEPELLNERLDRLATVLDEIMPNCALLVRDALELLKDQESVIEALKSDLNETLAVLGEQAEIVLCKDCKRKDTLSCPKAPVRPDDWFCADGERR
jgi:hypothetical protein